MQPDTAQSHAPVYQTPATNEQPEIPSDLIGFKEAAKLLPGRKPGKTVHVSTVYRFRDRGWIADYEVGGQVKVSRAEVLALVRARRRRARGARPPEPRRPTTAQAHRAAAEALAAFGLRVGGPAESGNQP